MNHAATDPFAFLRLQIDTSVMMAEASAVIWMRSLGMAGMWSVQGTENERMVSEKTRAFSLAIQVAAAAAADGPVAMGAAILRPVKRTTHSNVRRLASSGPRLPNI